LDLQKTTTYQTSQSLEVKQPFEISSRSHRGRVKDDTTGAATASWSIAEHFALPTQQLGGSEDFRSCLEVQPDSS